MALRGPRRPAQPLRAAAVAASALLVGLILSIAAFLVVEAIPALQKNDGNFLTTAGWHPDSDPTVFGIAVLVLGTLVSSALALAMAVPVALAVAVFITEYAPRRVARWLGYVTDMLAVVPSVVYGLWGLVVLAPQMQGVQHWMATWLGWIPIFADFGGRTAVVSRSIFVAAVVLAVMVLPVIAAVAREVLANADPAVKEGALALGATKWEMVRIALLPPSRPGIVGAIMLGFGRAMGETIAIALVLGTSFVVSLHVLQPGGNTIAANIATYFGEAGSIGRSALIATGLVLFVMTLGVNIVARLVVRKSATRRAVER